MRQIKLKSIIFVCTIFIVLFMFVICDAKTNKPDVAEVLYQRGDYIGSLEIYLDSYKKHPQNESLIYNIGNAYFKLGHIGKAICFYRKSAKLAPENKDIKANLKKARSEIVDQTINAKGSLIKKFVSIIDSFSFNIFLMAMITLVSIFNISTLVYFFWKKSELTKNIFFVTVVLFFIYLLPFGFKTQREFFIESGVIISKKVEVKSGPSQTLSTLFFIHEGTEFQILQTTRQWIKIKLENGFVGWINEDNFWKI